MLGNDTEDKDVAQQSFEITAFASSRLLEMQRSSDGTMEGSLAWERYTCVCICSFSESACAGNTFIEQSFLELRLRRQGEGEQSQDLGQLLHIFHRNPCCTE